MIEPCGSNMGAPEHDRGQVVAAEVLFAMHGDGTAFGEAGTDAVGSFVALVPQCAERQASLTEFALQRRIGDGGEYHALGIREYHRESRARDLLVKTFHLCAGHRQQFPHALL